MFGYSLGGIGLEREDARCYGNPKRKPPGLAEKESAKPPS